MFSRIDDNGVVKNLTLKDPIIRSEYSNNYVGGIASYNYGSIANCKVMTTVSRGGTIEGNLYVGGIAGINNGIIKNCIVEEVNQQNDALYVEADASFIGGIAGENRVPGIIEYCHVKCHVEGDDNSVGGIVGRNHATINQCSFNGSLYGKEWGNGGIAGRNHGGTISNCCFYSPGDVSGDEFTGGIVGELDGGEITNCCAAGSISGSGGRKGGLVGRCSSGSILNSFWDTQVTGCSTPNWDGADCTDSNHGLPTSDLMWAETFTTTYGTDWDFEQTWVIDGGADYPRLRRAGDQLSSPHGLAVTNDHAAGVYLTWNPATVHIWGSRSGLELISKGVEIDKKVA